MAIIPGAFGAIGLNSISLLATLRTVCTLMDQPNPRISESYGSHFQYLTVISLLASLCTFTTAVLHAIFSLISPPYALFAVLDSAYRTLRFVATPIEITIALTYWPLYILDPGLLAEKRSLPPVSLDIGLHLLPAVFLALNFVVVPPRQSKRLDSRLALVFFGFILAGYGAWLKKCRQRNGWWAYPVLEGISTEALVVLWVMGVGALSVIRELFLQACIPS